MEPGAEEMETFGKVSWSDELWHWQIGVSAISLLLTFGAIALLYGVFQPNVLLALLGLGFIMCAVVIMAVIRRIPGSSSFSRALLSPYRLGESEAHEIRHVYDKSTRRPPRR